MHRLIAVFLGLVCLSVFASPSEAATDDPSYNPPPQGGPGSETEHLFNPRLGGCRFSNPTMRPVNPDDVPSMGRCRRPERPTGGEAVPLTPVDIALEVTFGLDWPNPEPHTAPDWREGAALTGIPTWLWVEGIEPISGQSSGAGVVVQVSARPVGTTWNLREGMKRCDGLGRRYERDATSDCTHTFVHTSGKDGFWASVFVTWQVTWTASDGTGGSFGRAVTGSPFTIDVDEAQAVTD